MRRIIYPPVLLVYTPQLEVAPLFGGVTIRLPARGGAHRRGGARRGMLIPPVLGRLLLCNPTTLMFIRTKNPRSRSNRQPKTAVTTHLKWNGSPNAMVFASMKLLAFTIRKRGVQMQQKPWLQQDLRPRNHCHIRVLTRGEPSETQIQYVRIVHTVINGNGDPKSAGGKVVRSGRVSRARYTSFPCHP